MAAADAGCVDGVGPGSLVCRTGAAGTGHCVRLLEMVLLGSLRRSGAGRGAGLDLWVHTEQTGTMRKSQVLDINSDSEVGYLSN